MGKELITDLDNFVNAMETYKNYFSSLCIMCDLKGQENELTQRQLLDIGKTKNLIINFTLIEHEEPRIVINSKGEYGTIFEMYKYKNAMESASKLQHSIQIYCLSNPKDLVQLIKILSEKIDLFNEYLNYQCIRDIRTVNDVLNYIIDLTSQDESQYLESNDKRPSTIQMSMLLDELGIVEHLQNSYKDLMRVEKALGAVLGEITGINGETMRKNHRAIIENKFDKNANPFKNDKNITWLSNTMSKLKLEMKKRK